MQSLQLNAEIVCKAISGSGEVRFEGIENIVERNPRRARLNRYPDPRTQRIQPVIELVFRIEQEHPIVAHTRLDIRAGLPADILCRAHEAILLTLHEGTAEPFVLDVNSESVDC